MSISKFAFVFCVVLNVLILAAPTRAAILAKFDFAEDASGISPIPNLGIGPNGTLLEGAVVSNGVLVTDGVGQGLDIPLGVLSPFSGDADWLVQFDFKTEDQGGGPLFSSDNSNCDDGCNDDVAAGAINIFLTGSGELIADAWFIGAMGGGDGLNDGEFHTVKLNYTAEDSLWELFVDDLDAPANEQVWAYERDATQDRTHLGNQTNPDFGFEDIDPGADGIVAEFDNLTIEAPSPPPVLVKVNRDTGAIGIESISEEALNFNSLSLRSSSGSLDPNNWNSIAENFDSAGDGSVDADDIWTVDVSTNLELTETGAGDGAVLDAGQSFSLGEGVWLPSPLEDIAVELFDTNLEEIVRGAVSYEGTPQLFGDLNLDGELNGVDWELFVAAFGQDLSGRNGRDAYFLADLNLDGLHGPEDFIEFSNAYNAANGAGAFEAMAASVPEPASFGLFGLGACALLAFRRRRLAPQLSVAVTKSSTHRVLPLLCVVVIGALFISTSAARADLLAEYLFEDETNDSSGNGRDGTLDAGIFGDGQPAVLGGKLDLTGAPGESMLIPLGDANPFSGASDFTIDLSFQAGLNDDETGYLLLSSADFDDPAGPDNHSMALFLNGEGSLVYDNFFVGDVVYEGPDLRDDEEHQIRITFEAPFDAGEAGLMSMRVDGDWVHVGQIAPDVPNIDNHEVRLGSSLNEEFPFECEETCAVQDFQGLLDNVRIYDEAFPPSQLRAEVDRSNGDVRLIGGEFARDINYYEINSESGSLNAAAWSNSSLDAQNLDAVGESSGETWDVLTSSNDRVVEAFLLGGTTFTNETTVSLAGVWGGTEDLKILVVTSEQETLGIDVVFVGEGVGNMGPSLDCNGDAFINATDFDCSNAAGTTSQLIASLGLVEGDLNGDGAVSFPDFLVLSSNFSQSAPYSGGDINGDGTVSFPDFLILSANFGQTAQAVASVPEPASVALLCFGVGVLGMMRCRRN